MKYLIIILCTFTSLVYSQTDEIKGEQFELIGKIIRKPILPPSCGSSAWALNIEFEVIEFSDKEYTENTIDVYIPCPEYYGKKFFKKRKLYKILLSDEKQADYNYLISPFWENESERKHIKKLWAIEIERIK